MNKIKLIGIIFAVLCVFFLLCACDAAPAGTVTNTPEATSTEEAYVFPEDGVLKLLESGLAPTGPDGCNPSLMENKLVVYFECADKKAGLDLAEGTKISYKIKKSDRTTVEGEAVLDNSVSEIKNEYGYIGICFDMGFELKKFEYATFDLSFKDVNGKEYKVNNKKIYKGISYSGITASAFNEHLGEFVTTKIGTDSIKQTGIVNGKTYGLTITLGKWSEKTKPEQIVVLSRLFWYCYPKMYERFGEFAGSPNAVTLDIEDGGYEIASASGNFVHLYDGWLQSNPEDYDCITHELAHVIQNGWDGNRCEYSGYIERFADCCRYLYAFNSGEYNDEHWTLNTIDGESTRETSVRFLVWLDYNYSTEDNDMLLNFFKVCYSKQYSADNWDKAWAEIFKGSELEGKNIETVWTMYKTSEFAKLSSKAVFGSSALLRKYNVREKIGG